MRIAFVNHARRKVGGAEVYIDSVLPAFARAGHEIAWLYEADPPSDRELISIPDDVASWCVAELGLPRALQTLSQWRPDIVFTHGLENPDFEHDVINTSASVLYVHNYYGTCISGDKLNRTWTPHACNRRFGPACLLHYFPSHCGGHNPVTMLQRFDVQSRRLQLMRQYRALITNSRHMVRELANHGLEASCVYPFTGSPDATCTDVPKFAADPLRIVFAGRMSELKGGQYLLDALPEIQRRLSRPMHVVFAGEGPKREPWQHRANKLRAAHLELSFHGWLNTAELQNQLRRAHLLVYPSIWPEPFGLSGLEAGLYGVPTVAFAVGGIPEWLKDHVNGHLAPVPPSATGLAGAIVQSLANECHYDKLREGARQQAQRFQLDEHIRRLTEIFERCLARPAA